MSTSTLLLGALAALSLLLTLTCTGAALLTVARARRRSSAGTPTPPVTVLKPLKGADPDLYDNLAALARQDYPRFELVLGTADPGDPALEIAQRLAKEFPAAAIRVVNGIALQALAQGALLRSLRSPVRLPVRRLLWLPAKDLLVLALWPAGILERQVRWRGTPLTVGCGSVLRPADGGELPYRSFPETREAT